MKEFISKLFKESDGTPSLSRVCTGVIVLASISWVSVIVRRTNAFPDFSGLSLFVGTLYGLNHLGNVAQTYFNNKSGSKDGN